MAKSIREAMQAALAKNVPPPTEPEASLKSANGGASPDSPALVKLLKAANPKGKGGQALVRVTYGSSSGKRASRRGTERSRPTAIIVSPPRTPPAHVTPPAIPSPPQVRPAGRVVRPPQRLQLSQAAALKLDSGQKGFLNLLPSLENFGQSLQVESRSRTDQREVVLGFDFGTSCAKVVFGDPALGRSFATVFRAGAGVESYLLPSAVFQSADGFSLESGASLHRDLKLALLARPDDVELQVRVVAYLALAIRRARGWLFMTHHSVYRNTEIFWRMTLGIPAAQHLQGPFSELFQNLARAAWAASTRPERITPANIARILADTPNLALSSDVEVTVVPEIAAQIYGFVVSTSFDRHAPNLYLMADVGAGTVDASLFRVKPARRGRWDFEFYTSVVEPFGASNLHRHRCSWWADELKACAAPNGLREALETARFRTDIGFRVPPSFQDYFTGVQISSFERGRTPDVDFFERVIAQVQGRTFWRAWKNELLPQNSLTGIPFFLCGGGGRMPLYQRLETELQRVPGCSWLKAEPWFMGVPTDLEAPGMQDEDYDRLSVAYGLSRLDVGRVVQALPMSKLESTQVAGWRDNYVDKDLC